MDSGGMVDLVLRHILGIVQTATNTASTQNITIYSQVVSPRAQWHPTRNPEPEAAPNLYLG